MTQAPVENPSHQRSSVFDHPLGFWFFFWGEFAERCCFYGMRAILLLYMIQIIRFSDGTASRIMSYYMASCYLLTLIGGFVADNYLGKYRTIVYFSVPYIFGQVLLGIASLHNEYCLFLSLGLLAMGSGVIKPNISTLMGLTYDQRRPGKTKLRSDAFAMFYGAVNIGAALSSFAVPAIRNYYGGDSRAYAIAFLFPAGLMVVAFIIFALGKPFYAVEKIERVHVTPEERRQRWQVLGRLLGLFAVVVVFWAIFDQSTTTWTLFARDYLDLTWFGLKLSPDQLQTVNPVLIVLFLPPVTMFWHFLSRMKLEVRPTGKMLIGFVITGLTMAIVTWGAFRGESRSIAAAPAALAAAEKAAQFATMAATPTAGTSNPVASAAQAAEAAIRAALAAQHAAAAEGDSQPAAAQAALDEATRAEAAAEATIQSVKGTAQQSEPSARPAHVAGAAAAANRAATAAKSAATAAHAVGTNRDAAQANAALAALAATDAAALAAETAAKVHSQPVPDVVAQAEQAAAAGRVSVYWQIIPYLLITIAEICISVVGLELAFSAAPPSTKSFITACWLSTVFLANFLNAQVTPLYNTVVAAKSLNWYLSPGSYFGAFAVAMIPVTLAFVVMSRRFNQAAS